MRNHVQEIMSERKLQSLKRTVFHEILDHILPWHELENLPYLKAVIMEG